MMKTISSVKDALKFARASEKERKEDQKRREEEICSRVAKCNAKVTKVLLCELEKTIKKGGYHNGFVSAEVQYTNSVESNITEEEWNFASKKKIAKKLKDLYSKKGWKDVVVKKWNADYAEQGMKHLYSYCISATLCSK